GPKAGSRVARRGYDPLLARLPRVTAGTAALDGFTLHNEVRIAARDRGRLERLIRYMCRPPLANERLAMSDDGRVALELRRPYSDGSTHVLFAPLTFIEKLAALIPPPYFNHVTYHGLLAPNAPDRATWAPRGVTRAARSRSRAASTLRPPRPPWRCTWWGR
ncbi:MAG: transposase, partial [Planctomycetota bacterium]